MVPVDAKSEEDKVSLACFLKELISDLYIDADYHFGKTLALSILLKN